jgi:hypothetical protein
MAQPLYTFLVCDLMTNTVLAELPLTSVSFDSKLNDAGSFSGDLSLGDPRITNIDPFGSTQPGRTALYVDRGGRLVWGGILWTRRYESSSNTMKLGGNEFLSYLKQRLILANLTFLAQDQMAIARYVINSLQAVTGGNIGIAAGRSVRDAVVTVASTIVTSTTAAFTSADVGSSIGCGGFPAGTTLVSLNSATSANMSNVSSTSATGQTLAITPAGQGVAGSGVFVDQVFNDFELKDLFNAVTSIANVQKGFDFDVDVFYDSNGNPAKQLTMNYPRRGAPFQSSGYMFDLPGNALSYVWPEDATRMANSIWLYGSGAGNVMVRAFASDPSMVYDPSNPNNAGYPLLEQAASYKQQSVQSILTAYVNSVLASIKTPVVLPELSVNPTMDPVLGSYTVGDECRVRIVDQRFPNINDAYWRIVGIKTTPQTDNAVEQVMLTLSNPFTG